MPMPKSMTQFDYRRGGRGGGEGRGGERSDLNWKAKWKAMSFELESATGNGMESGYMSRNRKRRNGKRQVESTEKLNWKAICYEKESVKWKALRA